MKCDYWGAADKNSETTQRTKQTPVWEQLAPTGGKEDTDRDGDRDTDRDGDRVFGFSQRQRISRRKFDQLLKWHHVSAQLDRQ